MKFLSKIDSENFIASTRVSFESDGLVTALRFNIENERYRSFAIAKEFASWMDEFDTCIFLIKEYGIWPSSENWHLFERLRLSYGEPSKLHETPGHFFEKTERNDLVTYLSLAIQFGWGGCVLSNVSDVELKLSHDGFLEAFTISKINRIQGSLKKFEIPFRQDSHKSGEIRSMGSDSIDLGFSKG